MAEQIAEKPKRYYVNVALILMFMLGFGFLPPFGPVTELGMKILGLFIGCIYAWTVGETVWPSVLALILLGMYGDGNVTATLSSAYGNQTLLMVVFSMLFCFAVSESGLLTVVAKKMLSLKFAERSQWALAGTFFATASIAGALTINAVPVVILLWAVFYDVCEELGLKPYDKYVTIVMVGIVICAYAGSMIPTYAGLAIIGFGIYSAVSGGATVPALQYILTTLAINVVLVALLTFAFKLIGPKIDYCPGDCLHFTKEELTFTTRHKLALLAALALCALMLLPSLLGTDNFLGQMLTKLGTLGSLALVPMVLMVCTYKKRSFLDMSEGMSKGVPWNLYFLLATALTISGAIVGKGTGISELLDMMMAPLLSGRSPIAIAAILVALSCVITNCINNVVTITILTPIAYSYMTAAGGEPLVIIALMTFICLQGVVMPAGSVCGAMLHGNVEWLKPGMIYKYATFGELVVIITTIIVGIPMAMLLF